MQDEIAGTGSIDTTEDDQKVYLVIASVPNHFQGNQTYDYSVTIDRE